MKAVPDQIRQFLPNEFASLGADGFGFSDTRAAARRFFKNDIHSIVTPPGAKWPCAPLPPVLITFFGLSARHKTSFHRGCVIASSR